MHLVPIYDLKTLRSLVDRIPELSIVSLDPQTTCMRLVKDTSSS